MTDAAGKSFALEDIMGRIEQDLFSEF